MYVPPHLKGKLPGYYIEGHKPTVTKILANYAWMHTVQKITGNDGRVVTITGSTKWQILRAIVDHPQGNTEIVNTIGIDILTVRPCVTRMQERGLVFWNSERAPTERDSTERVNEETPLGYAVVAHLLEQQESSC